MTHIDQHQINQWLQKGLISPDQAHKMLADVTYTQEGRTENRFIYAIMVIGAFAIGLGAFLFAAARWQWFPFADKTILCLLQGMTAAACGAGYLFKYKIHNFSRAGTTLLTLGALLFGITGYFIADTYTYLFFGEWPLFLLVWLLCMLPGIYRWSSAPTAMVFAGFVVLWLMRVSSASLGFYGASTGFLVSLLGIFFVNVGIIHCIGQRFRDIGRSFALAGINIVMAGIVYCSLSSFTLATIDPNFLMYFGTLTCLAAVTTLVVLLCKPLRSCATPLSYMTALCLAGIGIAFICRPLSENLNAVLFMGIFVASIIMCLIRAYVRDDRTLLIMSFVWSLLFICVRASWLYYLRSNGISFTFIIGGLLIVIFAIFLEKNWKKIATMITKVPNTL